MGNFPTDIRSKATQESQEQSISPLRHGRLIFSYSATHDVVTLRYTDLVLETGEDVVWFEQECESFWQRFHGSRQSPERKIVLVDLSGIVVKPAVANAWNAVRARLADKYIARTYRYGGERRTVTAIHLGQVLNKTDGTIYEDREQALAAIIADRATTNKR